VKVKTGSLFRGLETDDGDRDPMCGRFVD
jgi:hypothetical protein